MPSGALRGGGGGVEMEGVVLEGEVVLNNEVFVDGVHLVHAQRVLFITLAAACCASLGLAPLLLLPRHRAPSRRSLGCMLAAGCGLLAAACAVLLFSALQKSVRRYEGAAGFAAGGVLLTLAKQLLRRGADEGELRDELWDSSLYGDDIAGANGSDSEAAGGCTTGSRQALGRVGEKHLQPGKSGSRKTALLLGVMALYATIEGIGIGVSFGGGEDLGDTVALAVMLGNLPEGLLIGLLLVPRMGRGRALCAAVGVHLGQPAAATAAFLFEKRFTKLLPAGLGLASGSLAAMTATLAPEAVHAMERGAVAGRVKEGSRSWSPRTQAAGIMAASAVLMLLFEMQFHAWQGQVMHIRIGG